MSEDKSERARPEGERLERKGGWSRLPFWLRLFLMATAAFVIGLASVNYIAMPMIVHRSKEVRVPALVGLPVDEARSALEEKSLSLREVGSVVDAQIPEGRVVRQDPSAGTSVRKARSVSVVLSKGPDVATVPQLEGESLRHASILLSRLGLRQGAVAHSFSPEVPADYVIGTDPAAGAFMRRGSPVSLLVSLGPRGEDFLMPNLIGLPLHETAYALEDMGFTVKVKESGSFSFFRRRVPTVDSQRPLPGKRVRRGDEIQLSQ
jgi:beta-lactam-binding protein with PASTA domain